ncbi:MAG: hypothetical protein K2X32_04170, partial [Phycisphaerales bacterium]|nr:hypothetical protein [Phycisphaerales bacterium]
EGIFEVFRFSDENRKSIAEGNLAALRAALKARGLPSIQQSAIRKALLGVTSVEEVQRVTAPPAAPAPAAAAPPKA